jgi:YVTN family beta-propeller protein
MRVGTAVIAVGVFLLAATARAQSGTIIAVNKAGSTVSLMDLKTHEVTATVPTGDGPHETAVSPDGRRALVTDYGPPRSAGSTITVIDIAQGALDKTISIAPHRRPHGIVWLPDGKHALVTSESDSALLILDVDSGAVTSVIRTGQAGSQLISLTADGGRAYVTNLISGSVTLIDLATHAALQTAVIPKGAEGLALRPDGKEVWVTSRASDRITVLSAADLSVLATIETGSYPMRIRFTPDGKVALVTCAKSSELRLIDVERRKETGSIKMQVSKAAMHGSTSAEGYETNAVPLGIAMSPDGAWAFVALGGTDAVAVVSMSKRDIGWVGFVGREPEGIAYSPIVRKAAE